LAKSPEALQSDKSLAFRREDALDGVMPCLAPDILPSAKVNNQCGEAGDRAQSSFAHASYR
jgi:hypothetical protein